MGEDIIAEYLRSYKDPATIHSICEDCRVSASIDLEHDNADKDYRVTSPLLAIWGKNSVVGDLYDVVATWQEKGARVSGFSLPCGHAIPEEAPEELAAKIHAFLTSSQVQFRSRLRQDSLVAVFRRQIPLTIDGQFCPQSGGGT